MATGSDIPDDLSYLTGAALPVGPLYPTAPPDSVRKFVAQETEKRRQTIQNILSDISRLQSLHNSLAPVNNLPPELLRLIFSNLLPDTSPLLSRAQRSLDNPFPDTIAYEGEEDIVAITHVCRHWRSVAILDPFLWTSISFVYDPAWVRESLARSKTMPISVLITEQVSDTTIDALVQTSHRLRSLRIITSEARVIERLWKRLRAAPLLEELCVEHLSTGIVEFHGPRSNLPPMFNGVVPTLRFLSIRGAPISCFRLPASLVYLEVVAGTMSFLPRFPDVLQLVASCPLLEILKIHGRWDLDAWEGHIDVGAVALPRLASIDLKLYPSEAPGRFLLSLSLPERTNIKISQLLDDRRPFGDALSAFPDATPPSLPCLQGLRRLLVDRGHLWLLQAHRDADGFLEPAALDLRSLGRLSWTHNFNEVEPDWDGFLGRWPFDVSRVETLVLVHGGRRLGYNPVFLRWSSVLQELPALRTLRCIGLPRPEVDRLVTSLAGLGAHTLCPELTGLELLDSEIPALISEGLPVVVRTRTSDLQESKFKRVELFNCRLESGIGSWRTRLEAMGVEVIIDED